jgi:hypothetical protein
MDTNGGRFHSRASAFIRGPCFGFPGPQVQNVGVNGIRWVAGLLVIVALLAIFARRKK